jgi:hypothetical protein
MANSATDGSLPRKGKERDSGVCTEEREGCYQGVGSFGCIEGFSGVAIGGQKEVIKSVKSRKGTATGGRKGVVKLVKRGLEGDRVDGALGDGRLAVAQREQQRCIH